MATRDKLIGTVVGDWRVVRELGEGGFATVYEAVAVKFQQRVALKVLHPEMAERADPAARFKQEAQLASSVKQPGTSQTHENIVEVIAVGDLDDGRMFIAYEYLDGCDLERCIGTGDGVPRPWDVHRIDMVVGIALQICRAMDAVSDKGIVHRDLKPPNIFLVAYVRQPRFPLVKLMDFGVSRAPSELRTTGVRTGLLAFGTLDYMAPEQLERPDALDHRVDVWAFGCILYELLTGGRRPFPDHVPNEDGTMRPVTLFDLIGLRRAGFQGVLPSQLRPDVDPLWDQIVRRCLAVDRGARYPDFRVLALDIGRAGARTLGEEMARGIFAEVWPDFAARPTDHTVPAGGVVPARVQTPPGSVPARSTLSEAVGSRGATRAERRRRGVWGIAAVAMTAVVVIVVAVLAVASQQSGASSSAERASGNLPPPRTDAAAAMVVTPDAARPALDAAPRAPDASAPASPDAGAPSSLDAGPTPASPVDAGAAASHPHPVADAGVGTLTVTVVPFAEVYVDGRHIGSTPVSHRFPAGSYVVRLETSQGTQTRHVKIRANHETTIHLELKDRP